MNSWLNHLYLSAYSSFDGKTLIISKKMSSVNKSNFEISKEISFINKNNANITLKNLKRKAITGINECWPVPPESGLAYALAIKDKNKDIRYLFQKKWEGDLYSLGERESLTMQLCFGRECKSSTFLDDSNFNDILMSLYEPILEHLN